jgi:hypothetical protein
MGFPDLSHIAENKDATMACYKLVFYLFLILIFVGGRVEFFIRNHFVRAIFV